MYLSNSIGQQATTMVLPPQVPPPKGKQLICQTSNPRVPKCARRSRPNAENRGCSRPKKRQSTQPISAPTTRTKRTRSASQYASKLAIAQDQQSHSTNVNSQSARATTMSLKLDSLPNQAALIRCSNPLSSYFLSDFQQLVPISLPVYNHSSQQDIFSNSHSNTITTSSYSNPVSSSSTSSSGFAFNSLPTGTDFPPLIIDPLSYIPDVYDNIFAPQVSAQTPLLKSIRIVLIKKLLSDHANTELLNRSINCFEELHDFTLEILRRTSLLT